MPSWHLCGVAEENYRILVGNSRPQAETRTVYLPYICTKQECYLLEILVHVSCQMVCSSVVAAS